MITTLLAAFAIFMTAFLGLAVGWLLAEKRLKGSCGGLNGDGCQICDKPCEAKAAAGEAQAAAPCTEFKMP